MNDSHLGDSIFGSSGRGAQQGGRDATGPLSDADPDATGPVPPAVAAPAVSRREARERDLQQQAPAPRPREARPRRQPDDDGRRPAVRGCLALIVGALVIGAALIFAISTLGSSFLPKFGGGGALAGGGGDYVGAGTGSVTITVAPGDSGTAIGETLQKAGVVKSASSFTALAANNSKFAALQPGTYRLRRHMSSADALDVLLDPKAKVSGGVTIPEGLWATEIYSRLSQATKVPLADYTKVPVASLGLPAAARGRVEGYLFPSTYDFPKGASAQTQLQAMVTRFKQEVASLGIPQSRLAKVTIVASLVEAEASRAQDGPKVARVVDNRIARGMPLQLDSTVNYLLHRRGKVTTSNGERDSSSPYNTYRSAGLPPGPIDNPGLASLRAAYQPAAGPWLYFVTVNLATGETVFASDSTGHAAAVRRFQAWCTAHPGKC
ncbi:endolytic transglycosylase MltG [Allobranchiibius sp. GilTou38]|uniref:endolytic transglycosylase MltG n=1 Tax=Allobranchiibius sp. GilTou38 TaxID=2815210 RepID=UPI001AA1C3D2|nr:endolytic transglycosylase MltG [Allobranchiibius sp. GilTou38]MBO1766234.1 endolytic transglycosylase MltG [Allobranchiibius sp. GilTou38]